MSCVRPVSGTSTTVQNSIENPDHVLYNALQKIIKFVQEFRHDTVVTNVIFDDAYMKHYTS